MHGLIRLQEKIRAVTEGRWVERDHRPEPIANQRLPRLPIYNDPARPELLNRQQISSAASLGWWDELNLDAALEAAAQEPELTRPSEGNSETGDGNRPKATDEGDAT